MRYKITFQERAGTWAYVISFGKDTVSLRLGGRVIQGAHGMGECCSFKWTHDRATGRWTNNVGT